MASRRSCHDQGNWYLQEGDHHYRFSISSHAGDWTRGWRRGIEANTPLLAVIDPERSPEASLPEEDGFFSVSAPDAVVSAIKKCEDDDSLIVRLYEIEGRPADVELRTPFAVDKAEAVNIIEEEAKPVPAEEHGLRLKLGRNSIETLKIWPKAKTKGK